MERTGEIIELKYDPMPDEFYKARITTLEKENKALRDQIDKLSDNHTIASEMADTMNKVNDEIIAAKDAEIARLKEALVNVTVKWQGGAA